MGEGNVFSLSVHTSTGKGYPHPANGCGGGPHPRSGGLLHLRSGPGSTLIPSVDGGGYSHLRSGWGAGGLPLSQVRTGLPPSAGYPPLAGWGTLIRRVGYPPVQVADQDGGYPNWNSIACTCYAAGGMPLGFSQEDFLSNLFYFC